MRLKCDLWSWCISVYRDTQRWWWRRTANVNDVLMSILWCRIWLKCLIHVTHMISHSVALLDQFDLTCISTVIFVKCIRSLLICRVTLQKDDAFIPHWFYLWPNSGIYGRAIFHTELKRWLKEELLHRNVSFSLSFTFSWGSQRKRRFYSRCGAEAQRYTVGRKNRHFLWFLMKKITWLCLTF